MQVVQRVLLLVNRYCWWNSNVIIDVSDAFHASRSGSTPIRDSFFVPVFKNLY